MSGTTIKPLYYYIGIILGIVAAQSHNFVMLIVSIIILFYAMVVPTIRVNRNEEDDE